MRPPAALADRTTACTNARENNCSGAPWTARTVGPAYYGIATRQRFRTHDTPRFSPLEGSPEGTCSTQQLDQPQAALRLSKMLQTITIQLALLVVLRSHRTVHATSNSWTTWPPGNRFNTLQNSPRYIVALAGTKRSCSWYFHIKGISPTRGP